MDSHRRCPQTSCVCCRTHKDVLCVLTDTHGRPVPRGPKSPKQSTGRASMLGPRTSVLICILMDSHERPPRTSCVCWRTPMDFLPRGPKSPKQSTGRASMLSPRTNVLICVLMDSRVRYTDTHGHTRTATDVLCVLADTHRRPPTWAKIIRTVHGKGQQAESKDQRADMCTDWQPRTSCVCYVLCLLNRQPTWAKITRTVHGKGQRAESKDQLHGKGQRAESKDQRADMCTDEQPQTSCVC
ncbi:unnamed protein product [Brassica rapa]|uniref:Uncharacterized protein n=1 Tax=Brassica campestris TaxID=3711 RepID=A0A8D9G6C2_BRACM|nr:unnamed protein product [Brassica rapa]